MEIAAKYFHEFNRDDEIVNDTFEVSDDIRDCIKLFDALEGTLTVSWETMFAEAKRYYEENGNLIVPQKYVNSNGYQLGVWVCAQRTNYHKKQYLSESRIERLESIGMKQSFYTQRNIIKNMETLIFQKIMNLMTVIVLVHGLELFVQDIKKELLILNI